ncbi:CobW family GTP-binding protein [Oceanobacillus sp. 1P07AA]|uniref:CobW family GTP-binding protein n=1 Tax=Oceanobacillus sp. 1P07AA TaxID=3132293 RepID=UPI0039A709CE
MEKNARTPVTIVTGYLGAGKTSFLNHLLHQTNEKIAIIVNEYGDIGIDDQLIEKTKEEIIEINQGCICCNVRKDLIDTLSMLLFTREQEMIEFDRVVIETTGLADPAPIVQTFLMDPKMMEAFDIDSVCTIVDSKHISMHLDQKDESLSQVAFADNILLNKMDLISSDQLEMLKERITKINPFATIYETTNSNIDINKVTNLYSFDLKDKLQMRPTFLHETHHHHDNVTSLSLIETKPLDLGKLNLWFSYLVQILGESLYRYKGILYINGKKKKYIFQGVHMLFAAEEQTEWGDASPRSEMVFIGKDLNKQKLKEQFQKCISR